MKKYIFFISLFLTSVGYTQSLVTDRPTQTESASTVPSRGFQLESGLQYGISTTDGWSKDRNWVVPGLLFRYGICERVELRMYNQIENSKELNSGKADTRISDLELGAKVSLSPKSWKKTSVAFSSMLRLPTAPVFGFAQKRFASINRLSFSHSICKNVSFAYTLGYSYFGKSWSDFNYSAVLSFALNDRLGFFIENYGALESMKRHLSNADAGFTFLINDNLQLDFTFGTGINSNHTFVGSGLSWFMKGEKIEKGKKGREGRKKVQKVE